MITPRPILFVPPLQQEPVVLCQKARPAQLCRLRPTRPETRLPSRSLLDWHLLAPQSCRSPQPRVQRQAIWKPSSSISNGADGIVSDMCRNGLVGVIAALIAALLATFTEPVLNRIAAKRMTLREAMAEVRMVDMLRFFRTVLATNLLKFPFFEAVNTYMASLTSIPPSLQGVAAACVYTSAVLPLCNYRYLLSLQMKVRFGMLYKAYWPTLLRDLMYGIVRIHVIRWLTRIAPAMAHTLLGQTVHTFIAIFLACLASAPGNELRAFVFQPPEGFLPAKDFFKVKRFLRSALLGALFPATAIAVGQVVVSAVLQVMAAEVQFVVMMMALDLGFALGSIWLIVRLFSFLFAVWSLFKLESAKQYYDPYVLPRLLKLLSIEAKSKMFGDRASPFSAAPEKGAIKTQGTGEGAGSVPPFRPANGGSNEPNRASGDETRSSSTGLVLPGGPDGSDGDDSDPPSGTASPSSRSVNSEQGDRDEPEAKLPSPGQLFRFVAPAFCLVVANSSMSSVDKAFLGWQSTLQLAAMGPAAAAFDSSSYLLTFLNTATLSLLGMTAGDPEKTRRIRSHAVVLATSAGIFLGCFLFFNAYRLTGALGATGKMLPFSVIYLRLRAFGAPIERGASVSTSFCLANKDGTTPLFVTLIGLVVNIVLDATLVQNYGLAGVAIASVFASAVGYGYLIYSLIKRKLWPWPIQWPGLSDIIPFLKFAGPVLFAVFLKTMALANMTAAACTLGTSAAAAHQIFSTLFLLTAVALGNPFSWAAQAFLPPLLAVNRLPVVQGRKGQPKPLAVQALARLLASALAASTVASMLIVFLCRTLSGMVSGDPVVLEEIVNGSSAMVPFVALYPALLTLEGALYAAQKRGPVLMLSIVFWLLSSGSLRWLKSAEMLSLGTIWLSSGLACGVAALLTAGLAVRAVATTKLRPV